MTIEFLITKIVRQVLNPAVWLLFSLGFVYFLFGVTQYVIGAHGDETKLKRGRFAILWGIIGMFVMFSAWGIVRLLCNFFQSCERGGIGGLEIPGFGGGGGLGGSGTGPGPSIGPFGPTPRPPAVTPTPGFRGTEGGGG